MCSQTDTHTQTNCNDNATAPRYRGAVRFGLKPSRRDLMDLTLIALTARPLRRRRGVLVNVYTFMARHFGIPLTPVVLGQNLNLDLTWALLGTLELT